MLSWLKKNSVNSHHRSALRQILSWIRRWCSIHIHRFVAPWTIWLPHIDSRRVWYHLSECVTEFHAEWEILWILFNIEWDLKTRKQSTWNVSCSYKSLMDSRTVYPTWWEADAQPAIAKIAPWGCKLYGPSFVTQTRESKSQFSLPVGAPLSVVIRYLSIVDISNTIYKCSLSPFTFVIKRKPDVVLV